MLDGRDQPHLFVHDSQFAGEEYFKYVYPDGLGGWINEAIYTWNDQTDGPEAVAATISHGSFHVVFADGNQNVYYATRPVPEPSRLRSCLSAS